METTLQVKKSNGFIKKNLIYIIVFSILCMLGNDSNTALIISIAIYAIAICFSSNKDRFCWSLFLIPNIRIYDNLGSTSLVNVLICAPFLFYISGKVLKKNMEVKVTPLLMAFFLFIIEYIHIRMHLLISDQSTNSLLGWLLGFMWCCYFTLDDSVNFDKSEPIYALSFGIICSAVVYLVHNPWFTSDMISKIADGHRFTAYADDPNYYSLYICLSLAGIVIKRNLKLFDYALMIIVMCIGLMTASKMCFLLIAVNIFYLIVGTNTTLNKTLRNFLIIVFGCCVVYAFRNYISQFIDILFQRSGGTHMTISKLTTGRYDVVVEYLELLKNDVNTLLFGQGFSYHRYLITSKMRGAHNTYLDFVLAWGLTGSTILFIIILTWFKQYKKRLCAVKYTTISKFPFFVLALSFLSLSCFSAGMFFFVIAFCLLQLEPIIQDNSVFDMQ